MRRVLLLLSACAPPGVDPGTPDGVGARLGDEVLVVMPTGGDAVTLRGRVFYNDRRLHGRFSLRVDPSGDRGTWCGARAACGDDELAALDATVQVIERHDGGGCPSEALATTAVIDATGAFAASFVPCDGAASLALRVQLRYCDDAWCFSLDDAPDSAWGLYHPDASSDAPLAVSVGNDYMLPDMAFRPAGAAADEPEDAAIAADYYASLVDTVRFVHGDSDVPFRAETYGEVQYAYPSTDTNSATTLSPSVVAIEEHDDWVTGEVVAHEYGHVLNLRAWDGAYGWDGVGLVWSTAEPLEPRLAFKEAWGNFVARAVFDETEPCTLSDFDDNDARPLPGPPGEGSAWATNVGKYLCDWYDTRDDDDPTLPGPGDRFAASDFYSMWSDLRNMYTARGVYGGDYTAGLTVCDWQAAYLDDRQSAATVGEDAHAAYVTRVTDLATNNGVACE